MKARDGCVMILDISWFKLGPPLIFSFRAKAGDGQTEPGRRVASLSAFSAWSRSGYNPDKVAGSRKGL
jgi:hypothetical protein